MTSEEFYMKDASEIQHIFSKKNIVVYSNDSRELPFNKASLLEIMGETQRISINGM